MINNDSTRYKLGIVFSGGGARGFAHLGGMKALEEQNITPDILAGTSVGALIAVLLADGYTSDELYNIAQTLGFMSLVESAIPKGGFFKSTGIQHLLEKYLRVKTFEELKIPTYVIASDIEYGHPRIFSEGDIIPAVTASCTVPIVFSPIRIGVNYYVDGGLFKNFPVSVIREKCKKIIGFNVSPVTPIAYDQSLKYMIERIMNYMVGANTTEERKICDYLIEPEATSKYSLFDFKSKTELYNIGYKYTCKYLDENQERLLSDLNRKKNDGLWNKCAKFLRNMK